MSLKSKPSKSQPYGVHDIVSLRLSIFACERLYMYCKLTLITSMYRIPYTTHARAIYRPISVQRTDTTSAMPWHCTHMKRKRAGSAINRSFMNTDIMACRSPYDHDRTIVRTSTVHSVLLLSNY